MSQQGTVQELKREIQAEQTALGVDPGFFTKWPWRVTYYRDDGEELPNLPGDPPNMRRYLDRGLKLQKPVIVEPEPVLVSDNKGVIMPTKKAPAKKPAAKMPTKGMPPKGKHMMPGMGTMMDKDMPKGMPPKGMMTPKAGPKSKKK